MFILRHYICLCNGAWQIFSFTAGKQWKRLTVSEQMKHKHVPSAILAIAQGYDDTTHYLLCPLWDSRKQLVNNRNLSILSNLSTFVYLHSQVTSSKIQKMCTSRDLWMAWEIRKHGHHYCKGQNSKIDIQKLLFSLAFLHLNTCQSGGHTRWFLRRDTSV